jgi:valyl-tRNA synthetase
MTGAVLAAVRRAKSDAKVSMAAEVETVSVTAPSEQLDHIREAEDDLKGAARTGVVRYLEGEFAVDAVLSRKTD